MLPALRKYRVSLILAHQYLEQIDEKTASAIFGNAGTIIVFRVGARDAEYLAKEFYPDFSEMTSFEKMSSIFGLLGMFVFISG